MTVRSRGASARSASSVSGRLANRLFRVLSSGCSFAASATWLRLSTGSGLAAAPHPQLLVRRLPSQQIKAYLEAMKGVAEDPLQRQWEFYHRCRMLQDFVSGMTDQHAQDEYRALSAL